MASIFSTQTLKQVKAISELTYCNPFGESRIKLERSVLKSDYSSGASVWNRRGDGDALNPNIEKIGDLAWEIAEAARKTLKEGASSATETELSLYEDVVMYALFHRYRTSLQDYLNQEVESGSNSQVDVYDDYLKDVHYFTDAAADRLRMQQEPEHIFALFYQIRRAFYHIYNHIIGSSLPAARLRSRVWESIFTHNLRRYRETLYTCMGDAPTLITGQTGTGKELVAKAIAGSQYIPFSGKSKTFDESFTANFHALNLSAFSPTLIESELFGHSKGAFTGALHDKIGWLEQCSEYGTVFLDEIGEIDPEIQVKLLRVLETRTFQRLGDVTTRRFKGKIIAATNRDLAERMREDEFRADFYYRLCADQIQTVSLLEQLLDVPDELNNIVQFLCERMAGGDDATALADDVMRWIKRNLDATYGWPGNVRELEQCVRSVLIHGDYQPVEKPVSLGIGDQKVDAILAGTLTADDLMSWYCTRMYARTGNYVETARRLDLDRRTVKSKVDKRLLDSFKSNDE